MQDAGQQSRKRKGDIGWIKEQASPSHFCKVIMAVGLEILPVPDAFKPYIGEAPTKITLRKDIGCA